MSKANGIAVALFQIFFYTTIIQAFVSYFGSQIVAFTILVFRFVLPSFLFCAYCTSYLCFFVVYSHISFAYELILLSIRHFHNTSMCGRASTLLFLLFLWSSIHTKQKKDRSFRTCLLFLLLAQILLRYLFFHLDRLLCNVLYTFLCDRLILCLLHSLKQPEEIPHTRACEEYLPA